MAQQLPDVGRGQLPPGEGSLGVYVDDVYRVVETAEGSRITVDRAFLLFVCAVGAGFDHLVLFGRTHEGGGQGDYTLPAGIDIIGLPYYASLHELGQVARASVGVLPAFWRGLRRVDTVWVFGPHPLGFLLIFMAVLRRRTVVLGVRQDTLLYYRSRLRSWRWLPMLAPVALMDWGYRLLAHRLRVTVVGPEVARRYGASRPGVLEMKATLVKAGDIVGELPEQSYAGRINLLTVSRLEPEKNPLLLVQALARLEERRPGRYRLMWAGRGALEQKVKARAETLGVATQLELEGYVPFGPALLQLYRRAHIFVHVSLTEGVPQVLFEALASGVPVVATDVGGVRASLSGGDAGLLVPPGDIEALADAVVLLSDDAGMRARLVAEGLRIAKSTTIEQEAARVAAFLGASRRG